MIDRFCAPFARFIATPRGFHLFIGVYLAVTYLVRTVSFPGVSPDDAEQLLFSQDFSWGYEPGNPPLFTWLVIAVKSVFGISTAVVEGVKFVFLFLTYAVLWRLGRRILGDDLAAAVSALSFAALYFFAWEFVLNFSHSVILTAFCLLFAWGLLRLENKAGWESYVFLGIVAGFGLLAKYSFALFALTLLAAALTDAYLRPRVLHLRMLAAVAVAALIVIPHVHWMLAGTQGLEGVLKERLSAGGAVGGYGSGVVTGLGSLAVALAEFLSPWVIVAAAFFWRGFGPLGNAAGDARFRRLLGLQLALILAVMLAGIFLFGAIRYRTSYMFVFALAPLYFYTRVGVLRDRDRAFGRLAMALALIAALVPISLGIKFVTESARCKRCYFHIPYPDIAADLRKAGFKRGTIVTHFLPNQIGGGLRAFFPDSRVFSTKYRRYRPAAGPGRGACLLVWDATRRSRATRARRRIADYAKKHLGADIGATAPTGTVSRRLAMSNKRRFRYAYILIEDGIADCR